MFEVTSAFGTVGLSVGDGGIKSLSALFTPLGKFAISFTMFLGRLGPLTLAVALTRKAEERFRYPEGSVIIG
jgi:trk system potassium uptake protein TrkH